MKAPPFRVCIVADNPAESARLRATLQEAAPGRWISSPIEHGGCDAVVVSGDGHGLADVVRLAGPAAAVVLLAPEKKIKKFFSSPTAGDRYPEAALRDGAVLVLPASTPGDVLDCALACAVLGTVARGAVEADRAKLHHGASERMLSLGTLSAGISHEINNPLASVVANLSVLASELPSLPQRPQILPELLSSVAEAQRGADRVAQIVRGLRMFSHGGSERGAPVDVAQAADAALQLLSNELRQRARVVRDFRPAPLVEVSEAHLTQVFVNLVLNAVQSIPDGAADRNEVRVSVCAGPDGDVVAEVSDSGAGMTPEVLARVFDPFFTTRDVGAGKGLGLSICHGIVTASGGRIEAFSEVRMGSRFRVTLPAVEGTSPPEKNDEAANRRGRVLLVEDDPLVARAVRRTLGSEHDVTFVDGARAALAALQANEFDVILCDLMMPEMTGMELHAELSRTRPDAAGRMVFLSGGAFTDASREFLARIPNLQIDKPFEPTHLREVVRRYVS